jgi:Mitochondrial import 2
MPSHPPSPISSTSSLPDSASSDDIDGDVTSESDSYADAEREWRESLQQVELVLTMILIPYLGRYFGRKVAYWGES